MKVNYRERKNTPGHGSLCCTGVDVAQGDVSFSLQRSSDQCYLSSQGTWIQEQALFNTPARREDGALLIDVGPSVVNLLDTQETYRFSLHSGGASGKPENAVLRIPSLNYDAAASTDNLPPPPSPAMRETPREAPPLPDAPVETVLPTPPGEERQCPPEADPPSVADPAPSDPEPARPPAAQKRTWLLMVGIVLLLCLALLIWRSFPQPPAPDPDPAAPPQAAAPTPAPAPARDAPVQASTERRVTLFFNGQNRTPAAAAELSRSLPRATRADQEAIYRLYYFAGENGETSVLMDYAACLDPTRPAWGGINKDPVAAWGIYEKAEAAGIAEAAEARRSMRQWLQAQEATGDAQAAYWLRQLP